MASRSETENIIKARAARSIAEDYELLASKKAVIFEEKYYGILNTRGRIIYLLKKWGPMTAGEITYRGKIPETSVYRGLESLRLAQLVVRRGGKYALS